MRARAAVGRGIGVGALALAALLPAGGARAEGPAAVGAAAAPATVAPWAQGVAYRIEARLDEAEQTLHARARLRYVNHSPDTLTEVHLQLNLNAFRPNSLWARHDLAVGIHTYQDLGPDDIAFERIRDMKVDGRDARLTWPFAPDSTILHVHLPSPLPPGGEVTLDYTWDARPSTVPRRQGRRGRHYDFAQWYPRVVVYDLEGWRDHPLFRQGEFYGEFATYDVTMEVRSDQVIGATGVPVAGDPGWEGAAAPGTGPITYQRDWYQTHRTPPCAGPVQARVCGMPPPPRVPAADSLGFLAPTAPAGFKRVRWHAENVHHFAWSTSPDYIYEQGAFQDVAVHVLYQPGDTATWGHGVAVQRTEVALAWLDHTYGDFAYPQLTNLHRIEGGGTEFPMMVMNGGDSQGLILHEGGHNYTYAILHNNQWYEGWLDEGMTSFQTDWFYQDTGQGEAVWRGPRFSTLQLDLLGASMPVVMPAQDYPEYNVYASMIYTKGETVLWMLKELVGDDTMRRIMHTYYERYKLSHVDSDAFQRVAEEVSRRDLDWFFGQWLHTTGLVDYALHDVDVDPGAGGGWTTELTLKREGDLIMPVPVRLTGADGERMDTTLDGWALEREVSLTTPFRPRRVELDPDGTILDWNVLNNAWSAGFLSSPSVAQGLDNPLGGMPTTMDRAVERFFPLVWENGPGGVTVGVQARTRYMGFLEDGLARVGVETGDHPGRPTLYARLANPVRPGRPALGRRGVLFLGEGREAGVLTVDKDVSRLPLSGPRRHVRATVRLWNVSDSAYLIPYRWAATTAGGETRPDRGIEAAIGGSLEQAAGGATLTADGELGGGAASATDLWTRGSLTLGAELPAGPFTLRARAFGGAAWGRRATTAATGTRSEGSDWGYAPRERLFFLAGADPLAEGALADPWGRSRDGWLDQELFVPGGGDVRGYARSAAYGRLASLGAEVGTPNATLGPLEARMWGFGAGALTWNEDGSHDFASAGAGVEAGLKGSPVRLRFDVPFWLSNPRIGSRATDRNVGFRWTLQILGY